MEHLTPEEFSAFLERDLPDNRLREAKAHVEACEDCRRELEEMRRLVGSLQRLPDREAPVGLCSGVMEKLRPAEGRLLRILENVRVLLFPTPIRTIGMLLAAAVFAVVCFSLLPMGGPERSDYRVAEGLGQREDAARPGPNGERNPRELLEEAEVATAPVGEAPKTMAEPEAGVFDATVRVRQLARSEEAKESPVLSVAASEKKLMALVSAAPDTVEERLRKMAEEKGWELVRIIDDGRRKRREEAGAEVDPEAPSSVFTAVRIGLVYRIPESEQSEALEKIGGLADLRHFHGSATKALLAGRAGEAHRQETRASGRKIPDGKQDDAGAGRDVAESSTVAEKQPEARWVEFTILVLDEEVADEVHWMPVGR